jgi:hypothetical protein
MTALDAVLHQILSSFEPYYVHPKRGEVVYWFCRGIGAPMATAHAAGCIWLAAQEQSGAHPLKAALGAGEDEG